MRNKPYPYTSPLPTFYVFGILIFLAFVLSSVACSRQITPQEQEEQLRAAQVARGETIPTVPERAAWVGLNKDVDKLVDPDTGNVCYRLNGDRSPERLRFDCVQGK
jgi:hypothetical protein